MTTAAQDTNVWGVLERQLASTPTLTWNPSRPIVLAVDSEKGGVGKSALTAGLLATMATAGHRVLGIDLDPRATLTEELGATNSGEYSVNDLLHQPQDADPDELPDQSGLAAQALRPASEAWGERVSVLAAERPLGHRETDSSPGLESRLRVALEGVAETFALTVIDLPPRAGGRLVGAALEAATDVLYPSTLDADGLIGARDARRTRKIITRTSGTSVREVGLVRNTVGRRTKLAEHYDDQLSEEFGELVLDLAVPSRVIRQEARAGCVPITAATGKQDAKDVLTGYTRVLNTVGDV